MAALTADRITEKKVIGLKAYPVAASTKIYAGGLVALNSSGFAVPAGDTAGHKVVGVAAAQADNGSGANGDIKVQCEAPILARFNATSITDAMHGQVMYIVDDNTFDDAAGTNGITVGRLVERLSNTEGWIRIDPESIPNITRTAAQINLLAQGFAAGYKIARGKVTPTATPQAVATSLATVVAVVVSCSAAPSLTHMFTDADVGDQAGAPAAGSFNLITRKPTGAADVTPIAATTPWREVEWLALGT